jgi:hypothetical protein
LVQVAPMVPAGLHGLIKVVENWTFSLFFCFAELWGSVVIAVLFWTLANDVCTVEEAKTVYPMMGISANVALVAAGNYMKYVSGTILQGTASTQVFLQTMVATIVGASFVMAAVRSPFMTRKSNLSFTFSSNFSFVGSQTRTYGQKSIVSRRTPASPLLRLTMNPCRFDSSSALPFRDTAMLFWCDFEVSVSLIHVSESTVCQRRRHG